jgi:alpha/beta superfamily hydrolase
VDCATVQRWAAGYAPQQPQLLVMPGAEHFFHGRLAELRAAVLGFLA